MEFSCDVNLEYYITQVRNEYLPEKRKCNSTAMFHLALVKSPHCYRLALIPIQHYLHIYIYIIILLAANLLNI